jgi:hypothetical protein
MEKNGGWVKMVAKVELQTLGCWGVYIEERSTRLEGNHSIKLLSFLHIFSKRDHTARMQVHTGYMPFFVAANNFCWSCGTSIDMEAQFEIRFLSSLV